MASAAFARIEAFDTTGYDCQIGGEVRDFDPKPFFKNPKDVRRTDRFAQLAMAAAKMALEGQRDRSGEAEATRSLRRNRQQWNRRTENAAGSADDPVDARAVTKFAVHDSDVDQQHGERPHLDGVRAARSQHVHRYRLRDLEQRNRGILADNQIWRRRYFPRWRLGGVRLSRLASPDFRP